MNTATIREHMEVVGSDGPHVGTVDHVQETTIKLTRDDPKAHGSHHWIPTDWVMSVDSVVRLNRTCDDAIRNWQTAAPGLKM
jgi:hypothetical protein